MFISTLSLVDALVHAGAYAEEPPAPGALLASHADVVADINSARVELYCDHNDRAVAEIRAARRHLMHAAGPVPAGAFDALNQASWLVRHDQYAQAEQALEAALSCVLAVSDSTLPTAASH
jgi:hypothetical protein